MFLCVNYYLGGAVFSYHDNRWGCSYAYVLCNCTYVPYRVIVGTATRYCERKMCKGQRGVLDNFNIKFCAFVQLNTAFINCNLLASFVV
jgi:hypothetical protein